MMKIHRSNFVNQLWNVLGATEFQEIKRKKDKFFFLLSKIFCFQLKTKKKQPKKFNIKKFKIFFVLANVPIQSRECQGLWEWAIIKRATGQEVLFLSQEEEEAKADWGGFSSLTIDPHNDLLWRSISDGWPSLSSSLKTKNKIRAPYIDGVFIYLWYIQ